MRVVGVCGSLQRTSSNAVLLRTAVTLAPDGVEVVLFDGLHELPYFNPDLEATGAPPPVDRWRRELAQSDAVLIASPEYGHSLSGVLKNAIDWVIGSGELYRKVVAITAAVKDPGRGHRGLDALAQTLGAVDAFLAWKAPIVQEAPSVAADVRNMLARLVDAVAVARAK
ncbi:MAG TPA: NADPH-dependent FMN reductase [Anaeromyxobacteraceae bacterium]|nr:NADPH-dependent FMN reductase [Anaeromyxobacteraceae bacterium]